jgi:Ca-activated chloride channel family protein
MIVLGVAVAALIVAAARPQKTVAVPVKSAAFVLANDVSDSMKATDVTPSRLQAAKNAAARFVADLPAAALVGQMSFARHPAVLESPTTDHALAQGAIRQLTAGGGGTAIGDTITTALRALQNTKTASGKRPPAAIVLLSDGTSNVGSDPLVAARQAKADHIPIYTIALGTSRGTITQTHKDGRTTTSAVPVNPTELRQIAQLSGGKSYSAGDAASAKAVYDQLAKKLGHRHVKQDLDVDFAGGALALLVAAGGLSLAWFGRLI